MKELKCSICGSNLVRVGSLFKCEGCGASYRDESEDSEQKTRCTVAFDLLRQTKFDEADEAFSYIINKFSDCYEAYWGKLLAKYGVVFVDDIDGKKVPTCFDLIENVTKDALYKKVLELAPSEVVGDYKALAEKIERVRAEWAEKASKEKPYDVFLCYKESDKEHGIDRTPDSVEVSNLYTYLTQNGYRVFYSRETLRGKIAEKYEPYIFGAIQTAPVMIVYGQKSEYFESTWMRNEWTRFIKRIEKGEKPENGLIVAYEKMDAYELPARLKARQCMDASKKTFYVDLLAHIERVVRAARTNVPQIDTVEIKGRKASRLTRVNTNTVERRDAGGIKVQQVTPDENGLIVTGQMYVQREMWSNALAMFDKVLKTNGSCSRAIWGRMLCEVKAKDESAFVDNCSKFTRFDEFVQAVSCAERAEANAYIKVFYDSTVALLKSGLFSKATEFFEAVIPYNADNRDEFISECLKVAIEKNNETLLQSVLAAVDPNEVDVHINAMNAFANKNLSVKAFGVAAMWYNKVLEIDEGEANALRGLVKCGVGCSDPDAYDSMIVYLSDYGLFEKLLSFCPSITREVDDAISGMFRTDAERTYETPKKKEEYLTRVAAAFDGFAKYYPKKQTKHLIAKLYLVADFMLENQDFEKAERYFAMIVTESQSEYRAYWGLLKAKLKCANDDSLARCSEEITTLDEFNSAVAAATMAGDTAFANNCVDISKRRKVESVEWEAKQKKERLDRGINKARQAVHFILSGGGLIMAVIALAVAQVMTRDGYYLGTLFTVLSAFVAFACAVDLIKFIIDCIKGSKQRAEHFKKAEEEYEKRKVIAANTTPKYMRPKFTISIFLVVLAIGSLVGNIYMLSYAVTAPMVRDGVNYQLEEVDDGYAISCLDIDDIVTLEIPESAFGKPIVEIKKEAFSNYTSLETVTIPSSVKRIGAKAFEGCTSLQSLTVSSGVEEIGEQAFSDCVGLTWLYFADSVKTIAADAFKGCTKLKAVTQTKNLTTIGANAFYDCTALMTFEFNKNLESIGERAFSGTRLITVDLQDCNATIGTAAFERCSQLSQVTLPKTTKSISDETFLRCAALETITLPSSITSIGSNAFGYSALSSITLPSELTSLGSGVFTNCTSLTEFTMSSRKITEIPKNAFLGCSSLSKATVSGSVTTIGEHAFSGSGIVSMTIPSSVTSIGDSAFQGCLKLKEVNIEGIIVALGDYAFYRCESLTSVEALWQVDAIPDYAFAHCKNLVSVEGLSNIITTIGSYAFYYCESLTSIEIPDTVTTIGKNAFFNCTNLTSVVLPPQLKAIPVDAFTNCTNLVSVFIPTSVKSIGNDAFAYCESLTSLNVPKSVTDIGSGILRDCDSIESISLPFVGSAKTDAKYSNFGYVFGLTSLNEHLSQIPKTLTSVEVTAATEIGRYAFFNCAGLERITLNDGITSVESSAFSGCSGLTALSIPDSVNYIGRAALAGCSKLEMLVIPFVGDSVGGNDDEDCFGHIFGATDYTENSSRVPSSLTFVSIDKETIIGDNAFYGCASIVTIVLPKTITSIGQDAFRNCSKLSSVINLDVATSIGSGAFYNCTAITYIKLPQTLTYISGQLFYGCTNLKKIVIPKSVTSIRLSAFYNCPRIQTVYYGGNAGQWASIQKAGNNVAITEATRYYYSETEKSGCWYYDSNGAPTLWQ